MKRKQRIQTLKITDGLFKKVSSAINAALAYEKATNGKRKLGITGEVGEIMVCYQLKELGLELVLDSRSEGFDAIDKNGKRVQIKTRRSESGGEPKLVGRMSRFSDHKFDYALLAFLDNEYNLSRVWKLSYSKILQIKDKEQTERSGPKLYSFVKAAGKPLFDRSSNN